MRKLYEIDREIENLIVNGVDPETGEWTLDESALEAFQMERDQKIENVILYFKDIKKDCIAIEQEISNLDDRKDRLEKTMEGLKIWLNKALAGQKFSTARCEVNFRRSESVEVDDDFCSYAYGIGQYDFITHVEKDTPNKTKIKAFLKNGGELDHCRIVEKQNIQIR